jgi:hypothetical protein
MDIAESLPIPFDDLVVAVCLKEESNNADVFLTRQIQVAADPNQAQIIRPANLRLVFCSSPTATPKCGEQEENCVKVEDGGICVTFHDRKLREVKIPASRLGCHLVASNIQFEGKNPMSLKVSLNPIADSAYIQLCIASHKETQNIKHDQYGGERQGRLSLDLDAENNIYGIQLHPCSQFLQPIKPPF